MISSIIFILVLAAAVVLFYRSARTIRRNILLGRDYDPGTTASERWKTMLRVAFGQSKMGKRPIAALMHLFVYVGFILINIEVLEIIIDGIFGTHRFFSSFLGQVYFIAINFFEILALLVILGVVVFWMRRVILRLPRFWKPEMKGWPTLDALNILYIEVILMTALLVMNAADQSLMNMNSESLAAAGLAKYNIGMNGTFYVSALISNFLGSDPQLLFYIERTAWWFHIIGILAFLNYLPFSKHFHIILAFPNTFYADLKPLGEWDNLASVKKEVDLMMDPNADPYASGAEGEEEQALTFGAKDVTDLNWKQLMDAYTCTECGRCTAVCPANQTGKLLSPRKIMMDTRDRLVEVGSNLDKNGTTEDGKSLLHDYIQAEELWACTTCNACVEECPVMINPVSIITELRRYLVMEESAAPQELNGVFTNIENNGAPWQFAQADRLNWSMEK